MELLPEKLFYKELDAKDFLMKYGNSSAVSISGGKDSLVALDLSYRVGIKKFVFGNTSMAFPKTEEYIKKLETFFDIEIEQVKPPRDFLDLVDEIGYPSQRLRWCCEVYKFAPLTSYVLKNKIKFLITGIRSEESRKRQNYSYISRNPLIPTTQINPILDWTTEEIWQYIKYYNLPYHPLYNKGYDRLGCWMCPFQKTEGFKRLKKNFPELYNTLIRSLYKNVKKFGKYGVRDIHDYIEKFAWTKNALPITNILKGSIEYKKDKAFTTFLISCNEDSIFQALKENIKLLKKKSNQFSIDNKNLKISIKSNELNINRILIYCEKQINCVGCGACISLCPNSAIKIYNKKINIDFSKCNFCLECLSTTKLRAGCIARNYAPIRKKFKVINLQGDFVNISKTNFNDGLIKTRKNIFVVRKKLEDFFQKNLDELPKYLKINGLSIYSNQKFYILLKKEKGYTTIYLDCNQTDVKEDISMIFNILDGKI